MPTPSAPNRAATDRFHAGLTALTGPIASDQRLGVAFSGGPDSLALLLLCHAAFPGQVWAATVDHGLRPESGDEVLHCAQICTALGVPHACLKPAQPIMGSIQSSARAARYQLLNEWADSHAISVLLTAHHADDQAETLLMRLNRGSGIGGLAAIRAINGRVFRPLLDWRRAELTAVVTASGLTGLVDPSNQNNRFDRARIRKAMAQADWLNVPGLAQSSAALADAQSALEWSADHFAVIHIATTAQGVVLKAPTTLPAEICRRLVLRCLAQLDAECHPSGPETSHFITVLLAGGKASIGALLGENRANGWLFSKAPPRSPRSAINSA